MSSIKILRKMRPRKYKHGFKIDYFGQGSIIPAGRILEDLQQSFLHTEFTVDFSTNYSNCDLTIYTNEDHVANHIEKNYVA